MLTASGLANNNFSNNFHVNGISNNNFSTNIHRNGILTVPPCSPSTSKPDCRKIFSTKKKVCFADEQGKTLVTIYKIPKRSDSASSICDLVDNLTISNLIRDEPSYKNIRISENCAKKFKASQTTSEWRLDFNQPVSNYAKFRQKLDENNVALENVLLKPCPERIFGVIKVKNLATKKHVFIRISFDNWKSFIDHPAVYKSTNCNVYDTFQFEIEIPNSATHSNPIEFAICYRANEQEFWDNNERRNFKAV